jgi:hypothetical protein
MDGMGQARFVVTVPGLAEYEGNVGTFMESVEYQGRPLFGSGDDTYLGYLYTVQAPDPTSTSQTGGSRTKPRGALPVDRRH